MHVRIVDLDGAVAGQAALNRRYRPARHDARAWGPAIRLACRRGRFARFERALAGWLGPPAERQPALTLYGSGDFHHVSLALVRRLTQPFNLLVVDKHPDWMRGVPFLHCGTWLYHAARLPLVRRVFHVGGDLDFDNGFRWLAPWRMLRTGKVTVLPAIRRFRRGAWAGVRNEPVRPRPEVPTTPARLGELLEPFRPDLGRWPLYISLDKDVMTQSEAAVNWDSGHLTLPEVEMIVQAFLNAAHGRLAGADVVGDWSPVRVHGAVRRLLHLTEHPRLEVDPAEAAARNERTNLFLVDRLRALGQRQDSRRRQAA
jgi:hypothetical protein